MKKKVIYKGLGFPVILIGFKTKIIGGEVLPLINFKMLQAMVFEALLFKQGLLTGSEVLFTRSYLGLSQLKFARMVGLANHSRVCQWEKRSDKSSGMEFITELSVRLLMASAIKDELISDVYKQFRDKRLKKIIQPVEVNWTTAA